MKVTFSLQQNKFYEACTISPALFSPLPSFFLNNQEMFIQLPLILIFGMAAFCSGIGILVLKMKPREAFTIILHFGTIHY